MVERGTFVEAISTAPGIDADAIATRGEVGGRNVRVLDLGALPDTRSIPTVRMVSGGFLVQDSDAPAATPPEPVAVTRRAPTARSPRSSRSPGGSAST